MKSEYYFPEQKDEWHNEQSFLLAERRIQEDILLTQIREEENKLTRVMVGGEIKFPAYLYQPKLNINDYKCRTFSVNSSGQPKT